MMDSYYIDGVAVQIRFNFIEDFYKYIRSLNLPITTPIQQRQILQGPDPISVIADITGNYTYWLAKQIRNGV